MNKIELSESGYVKSANRLRGLIPVVKQFGIVTAANPMGKKQDDNWNKQANNGKMHPTKELWGLERTLKDWHLAYKEMQGFCGNLENPYFIPNISKKEIMKLGKSYDQKSVIFGEITDNGMSVTEIEIATTHEFPFPEYEYGYEDYDEAYWGDGGEIVEQIKEHARNDEEFIRHTNLLIDNSLNERRVGKDRWISRYRLLKYMREYKTLVESKIRFQLLSECDVSKEEVQLLEEHIKI